MSPVMRTDTAEVAHAEDLADFVAASPSSHHAAAEVARRLTDAGFTSLDEASAWRVAPGDTGLVVRDGAVIAWAIPSHATAFHIFGAHSDSPACRRRDRGDSGRGGHRAAHGAIQLRRRADRRGAAARLRRRAAATVVRGCQKWHPRTTVS